MRPKMPIQRLEGEGFCEVRQCDETKAGYPFGPSHLTVKTLFATAMGLAQDLGLDGAYQKLGLKMEGRHYRGDDDAWNIAAILGIMLERMRNGPKAV